MLLRWGISCLRTLVKAIDKHDISGAMFRENFITSSVYFFQQTMSCYSHFSFP